MGSVKDTIIAYEAQRLRAMGYGVTVSAECELPADGQLGNDVVVGTLVVNAETVLATEGAMVILAPGVETLAVLRRRVFCPGGAMTSLRLSNAVRLHPYAAQMKQEEGKK